MGRQEATLSNYVHPLKQALLPLLILVTGCGVDFTYLLPAAAGQLDLLLHAVPIEDALDAGTLTEEQIDKLNLVLEVRSFAGEEMGLYVESTYTSFYDPGDRPVAYNLSASLKHKLEPRIWSFPFAGSFPYLGFFDRQAVDSKQEQLESEGYDVYVYELQAYNLGRWVPNPILAPMLERDDIPLAETVIHELLHSTVARPSETTFNESLATFVGRRGAIAYFSERFPDQPELAQQAIERFEDEDRFAAFVLELIEELEDFYDSDLTKEEKIEGREEIYQAARGRFADEVQPLMNSPERYDWVPDLPTNNAYLLGLRRYNLDLNLFEQVFVAADENWQAALELFAGAAAAEQDPYDYLRNWLASGP